MRLRNILLRWQSLCTLAVFLVIVIGLTTRFLPAQTVASAQTALEPAFDQMVKPFFEKNCVSCHNAEQSIAGIRVDLLDARLEDRHIQVWESILRRVRAGTMPPKGLTQPTIAERDRMVACITKALDVARMRPAPKNGLVRRLTVSQYRNTLRELLQLDDDLTVGLPPDAVSKDGFLNNFSVG